MTVARDESTKKPYCSTQNHIPSEVLKSLSRDVPIPVTHRPEVHVKVFDVSVNALLDSRASVSAISEDFLPL